MYTTASLLNGFKISDIDELIPALILDLGSRLCTKLDVSRFFISYKDNHLTLIYFVFS